jgi:hypothetical protein
MTISDIIHNLEDLNSERTIYARQPWSPNSLALVVEEPADGKLPEEAISGGLVYFIEISIAQEFLEDWTNSQSTEPSHEARCSRLIHYAEHDA